MKLQVTTRAGSTKGEVKIMRREGNIPAILYHGGKPGEKITILGVEFSALLRKIPSGRLSTTVFELNTAGHPTRKALIKDIQYNPTTYSILHLDFEELVPGQQVNVNVPIECTGIVDCTGIKLGGVLRQVIRGLRIRCLPQDMPTFFQIDIRAMMMGESKRLKDLQIPESVRPLADLNEVALVITKR